MSIRSVIRTCEWSRTPVELSLDVRAAIAEAAANWRTTAGLSELPVTFSGPNGNTLCTCQHVGVIEVDDCTIEILPKLDTDLLNNQWPDDRSSCRVMDNLLWMLSSCGFMELTEVDRANLKKDEIRYYDLFAFLLAKNLLNQLQAGVPHAYVEYQDDLYALRGTIDFCDQICRNWNRMDRISCRWEEFTPDTALNRVFKSACRLLQGRVKNHAVLSLLEECEIYLNESTHVDARTAIQIAQSIRWSRSIDRFRSCFDLAIHLLAGEGFQLAHAESRTFVFLLDMNRVFEAFAGAVLGETFGTPIIQQGEIGKLLITPARVRQIPDFQWNTQQMHWIGDAKYKRLDSDNGFISSDGVEEESLSSAWLGPADIRQMTVYAEIYRKTQKQLYPSSLAVLFPVVGDSGFHITPLKAWNGSHLFLIPVRLDREVPLNLCTPISSAGKFVMHNSCFPSLLT